MNKCKHISTISLIVPDHSNSKREKCVIIIHQLTPTVGGMLELERRSGQGGAIRGELSLCLGCNILVSSLSITLLMGGSIDPYMSGQVKWMQLLTAWG